MSFTRLQRTMLRRVNSSGVLSFYTGYNDRNALDYGINEYETALDLLAAGYLSRHVKEDGTKTFRSKTGTRRSYRYVHHQFSVTNKGKLAIEAMFA